MQLHKIEQEKFSKVSDGRYKGDMLNGLRHGRGRQEYENGEVYEGEWFKD